MYEENWMRQACNLAYENVESCHGGPFGCVIVFKNKIIAEGVNRVVENYDPTAHAEIQALRHGCKTLKTIDLSECAVYSSCEPCSMCFSALRWAGISTIYFCKTREDAAHIGFRDDDIYNQIIEKNQNLIHLSLSLEKDAFVLWESTKQKQLY